MTFEKTTSPTAFIKNNSTPELPPDKRKLIYSPSLPKPRTPKSNLAQDNLSSSGHRLLNRAHSDNTFLTQSPLIGVSGKTWGSSILAPHGTDRRHPPKASHRSTHDLKHHTSFHTSLHSQNSDSYGRDRSFKKDSLSGHTDSDLKRNVSSPIDRGSKETHERVVSSKTTPCHRESTVNPPTPMPKSSGQSSRSSVPKRPEKDTNKADGRGRSSNPEAEDLPSPSKRRSHSADGRQKETTTCSFFYFIRKKKKVSSSPSPDTKDKKSNRKNSRSRSILSCSSAQSKPTSERVVSPSDKDRRLSLTSSRIPQPSISSTQPPSVTSPSATTPLLTPPLPPSKHKQYASRSRSKNRRGRRHRTSKRAFKVHPDDRLQHEDLPPHPSICKSTVVRRSSEPATSHTKPVVPNVHINAISNSNNNNSSNIQTCNVHFSSNINSEPRRISKPESSVNIKSAVASSGSGGNRKDSTAESGFHVKDKSQHSASKTDLEEDFHCQFTTSSSDQLSRKSFRSQSLPSFRGEGFLQDVDTKVISDAEDFEFCPTDMKGPLNLSLCGCGFLGMYHLGVVSCLTQRGLPFLDRVEKVAGASAGALMAAVMITARDKIEESAEHVHNLAKEIRRKPLGALTPGYSFTRSLRYMLDDILPEDAHESAQGKLFVSLTNADTKKNEMLSDFRSRDELIEILIASCYIPVYAGIKLPTVRGKKYIDGGLSDNLPRFEAGRTITVSPFDGKSDIGPKKGQEAEKKAHFISIHNQDVQVTMNNLKKGAHAFFPPKRQTLQEYFEKGRYDASRFLIKEGLYEINSPPPTKTVLYESSV